MDADFSTNRATTLIIHGLEVRIEPRQGGYAIAKCLDLPGFSTMLAPHEARDHRAARDRLVLVLGHYLAFQREAQKQEKAKRNIGVALAVVLSVAFVALLAWCVSWTEPMR